MPQFNPLNYFYIIAVVVLALPACRKDSDKGGGSRASAVPPPQAVSSAPATPMVANVNVNVPASGRPGSSRPVIKVAPASARKDDLWFLARRAAVNMNLICARGYMGGIKQAASVTHYFIAPGARAGDYRCRNGLGYFGQPNMAGTCLHPCRTVAADPRFHRPGEVLFFQSLVGLTCGSGRNKMVHDGFMVVTDNGDAGVINFEGRFGTFWGRCNSEQNGFCLDEGAIAMDFALTFSNYCRAWRPQDPTHHGDLKLVMYNQVRSEAARRGDNQAASNFDLDNFIGLSIDANGILYRR